MTALSLPAALLAHGHRHGRPGLILLILLVLAGLAYGGYRWVGHRRRRRHGPGGAEPEWGPLPSEATRTTTGTDPAGPTLPAAGATGVPADDAPPVPTAPPVAAAPVAAAAPAGTNGAPNSRPATMPVTPPIARPATAPARRRPASGYEWAVETDGLTKFFGPKPAVDHVELRVPRGSAFGYLGPNGAGKTTLIRTLLGLTRADAGTMSLLGVPVPAQRSRALARVGAIVDEPRFHGHLSGRDNLRILAAARGAGAVERITPSLGRVGLAERADDRVSSYSMGMRQRLGVAACLLGDPDLLILDEPMNGLDPAGMHAMRYMIRDLVDEGRTVMLSSHLLDEVERTCDAVAIVDSGRVIRQGSIDELLRGANVVVEVECSDPAAAARLLRESGVVTDVVAVEHGLTVSLPSGSSREVVAEVNRRLVEGGIAVYTLRELRASLEDWFLSVTSRLGEPA